MSLKPLVHYALFHKYKLRYTTRANEEVRGVFTTPTGAELPFVFNPSVRSLAVNDAPAVTLNDHGWEVNEQGEVVFRSAKR